MGQIMLNGNAYAGGYSGACGGFVDTTNVIQAQTSATSLDYTATQDCAVYLSVTMSANGVLRLLIDGVQLYAFTSSSNFTYQNTIFLRRGQRLTSNHSTTPSSGHYTVFGVIQGLDSSIQNRYSTNEKAVGVWIDGSTIYEKTYELQSELEVSNTSWTATTIDASSISRIVGVEILGTANYQGSALANKTSGNLIQLQTTRNSTAFCKYLVLRYTKAST